MRGNHWNLNVVTIHFNIYNPTEYYVVFAGLAVDKTDLTSKIEYIAPGEHKTVTHFLHLAERT